MNYTNRLLCNVITLLLFSMVSFAQNSVSGVVVTKTDGTAISDCYVMIVKDGKVVKSQSTDKQGKFRITDIADGTYMIGLSRIGYAELSDSVTIAGNIRLKYKMEEIAKQLDEVTVTGDRSTIVKRTANGEIFYLSEAAKKEKNPFVALQEIPILISDPATASVKLMNGKKPKVLIDGNVVNTGINPISPADIESVEVIRNVSARFLQMGVDAIINIKLKRSANIYQWYQVATRHDIPLDYGMGVGYFEVGNKKLSLYGRTAYDYNYHEDVESTVDRSNTTYSQNYKQTSRKDGHSWLGDMMLKSSFTPKDYFAAYVYGKTTTTKYNQSALGTYETTTVVPYSLSGRSHDKNDVFTSSLYYKHSFASNNNLEFRLAYNYNRNDYEANQTDTYGESTAQFTSNYKNSRNSGSFDVDYAIDFANGSSLTAGSNSAIQYDKINDLTIFDGLFRHRNFSEYLYLGYAGCIGKKVLYSASLGMQGIWLKAGDVDNNYFRPRASVGITYKINKNNSVRLDQTVNNSAPAISQLNANNVSTDSLVMQVGNPMLTPQMTYKTSLRYTFNKGKLYIEPNATYEYDTDQIQDYGYTRNDGVYVSTYRNLGKFRQWYGGLDISYRIKKGFVSGSMGWEESYFENQNGKGSFFASLYASKRIKKFSFYLNMVCYPKEYSSLSYTRNHKLTEATFQMTYNFTPDFYISMMVQHMTGEQKKTTYTDSGTYHSVVETRYKDKCFRPWILIRYTFRKHSDKKIKMGTVLNSKEKGITITR